MIERVHQTIGNAIKTINQSFDQDWGKSLQTIAFAHRAGYHRILGMSPAQVLFQRDMIVNQPKSCSLEKLLEQKLKQMKEDNQRENSKRQEYEYRIGDLVMLNKSEENLPK